LLGKEALGAGLVVVISSTFGYGGVACVEFT
jgi:hypothetical protein